MFVLYILPTNSGNDRYSCCFRFASCSGSNWGEVGGCWRSRFAIVCPWGEWRSVLSMNRCSCSVNLIKRLYIVFQSGKIEWVAGTDKPWASKGGVSKCQQEQRWKWGQRLHGWNGSRDDRWPGKPSSMTNISFLLHYLCKDCIAIILENIIHVNVSMQRLCLIVLALHTTLSLFRATLLLPNICASFHYMWVIGLEHSNVLVAWEKKSRNLHNWLHDNLLLGFMWP